MPLLALLRASILALLPLISAIACAAESTSPNVVIIFTDDQGYGDLGCYGSKTLSTPNIDRLAAQGIRFTDFYVPQAVCTSSRAALLTGCYSNRIGLTGALGPRAKIGIHDDETTIAELLKSKGYATAIFGKWHLGHLPRFLPTRHGFDQYFGLPYSNDMWPRHPTSRDYPDLPLIENDKVIGVNPDQTRLTTWYTERAVKFIEQNAARPFFLYVPHSMPHVPLYVSPKHQGKSPDGLYGDVISEIDWSVGEILAALEKHKLADRTLVVFTCDNGPWLSYGNHAGSTGGLREGKATEFEGGVRIPCVARLPGLIPAGAVCHEPAMTIDWLPTIAELTGAALPTECKIDGLSIAPLLRGEAGAKSPHEALYFYWINELHALRSGRWKLHLPHTYPHLVQPGKDGRPGPYADERTELALYNLAEDRAEQHNVADTHPEVVERLQKLAEAARADLGDRLTGAVGSGVRAPGRVD
jgi:arylsulfatase A-like enzyme